MICVYYTKEEIENGNNKALLSLTRTMRFGIISGPRKPK